MIEVSNPDKVMFPDAGYTKADVVAYYGSVASRMVPHLAGRPLTLQRFPNGIGASGFMQKNAGSHFPAFIRRVEVPKREGGTTIYAVVDDAEGLTYLANQGTVSFHVWTTALPDLDAADRIVIDLDPPEGDYGSARRAAHLVKGLLERLQLPAAVMTTGSNGYHIVVRIEPEASFDQAGRFAHGMTAVLAASHPEVLTSEFRKKERRGRVFVDWLRNRRAQTGIAPYSLRARPGAPVAAPIGWDEIETTDPQHWTLPDGADLVARSDAIAALEPVDGTAAFAAVEQMLAELDIELEAFDRFRS